MGGNGTHPASHQHSFRSAARTRRRNPPHHRSRLLAMLLKRPFLLVTGTFPVVLPEFRSFYTHILRHQAHNDYCNCWSKTGLAGFAIGSGFCTVFHRAASNLRTGPRTPVALNRCGPAGLRRILVHSFSISICRSRQCRLFYVLCAIAAAGPLSGIAASRVFGGTSLSVEPNPESSAS